MVKTNPNSQTEANLLLLRAECFEESGKTNEADEIYVSLNKKFAGTAMGGHAFNRLARLDSDEREHFGIAFASKNGNEFGRDGTEEILKRRLSPQAQLKGRRTRSLLCGRRIFGTNDQRWRLPSAALKRSWNVILSESHCGK
jgi:hypothetical protein